MVKPLVRKHCDGHAVNAMGHSMHPVTAGDWRYFWKGPQADDFQKPMENSYGDLSHRPAHNYLAEL